ncbi:MAG: sigma-70 family RNA polymerase sigma factor [Candidatus Aminicenantes bacterium]|nr:sigma-70 family RNA polymerase sigma factor [Candidatus Aminicenantes bacterium]
MSYPIKCHAAHMHRESPRSEALLRTECCLQGQNLRSIEEAVCVTIGAKKGVTVMSRNADEQTTSTTGQPEFLKDWIRRSRSGDTQAMGSIYEHFKTPLFSLACRYTRNPVAAEDLIQDIFLKAFTHLRTLDNDDAFVGWLYRIAVNTCLSHIRSSRRLFQREVPLGDVEGVLNAPVPGRPEDMLDKSLEEAVQKLSPRLKSVFILHDIQGFKHDEVAQIMECSAGTSKSQLFKARMRIRRHLEKKQLL